MATPAVDAPAAGASTRQINVLITDASIDPQLLAREARAVSSQVHVTVLPGKEPLPADSPFWSAPNTIITPHFGATTPLTYRRGADIFLDNLRRYVAGEALFNVVDKDAGY